MSTFSATPSFERSVALKKKRRAESVSSVSTDGNSDEDWSRGGFAYTRLWHSAEGEGNSGVPAPSIERPGPDHRPYRFSTKRRRQWQRQRRRTGRPSEKTVFGSFKPPEEPLRLPGFKDPPRPTASGTQRSPEAPIYLCKDGFDEAECVPERKSVFVPRNRHREIAGLGALALGKPVLGPARKCAPLSSPVPAKSYLSEGEVGLFGPGSGCVSPPKQSEPMGSVDSHRPVESWGSSCGSEARDGWWSVSEA